MFASFSCSSSNPVCLSIRSTGKSLLILCSTNSFTPQVLVPSAWRLALHIGHSCLWSWKDGQQTIFQHDCPPHQISLNAASAKRVSTWGGHRVPKQTKAKWTVEVSFLKGEKLVHNMVDSLSTKEWGQENNPHIDFLNNGKSKNPHKNEMIMIFPQKKQKPKGPSENK